MISYNTVRTHIRNIYRQLDVHSRLEAVKRGQEFQVVQPVYERPDPARTHPSLSSSPNLF
ncbi:MAG: helix-turn-helix transcriptional regulator [Anaerolineales bacterium]